MNANRLAILAALGSLGPVQRDTPPAPTADKCAQCRDCAWAWDNMQTGNAEEGWCYMFSRYVANCAQHKPNR